MRTSGTKLLLCGALSVACNGLTVQPVGEGSGRAAPQGGSAGQGAAGVAGDTSGGASSVAGSAGASSAAGGSGSGGAAGGSGAGGAGVDLSLCIHPPQEADRPGPAADGPSIVPIELAWSTIDTENENGELVFDYEVADTCGGACGPGGCKGNQFGRVMNWANEKLVLDPYRFSIEDFRCELHRGSFSMLMRISDYNGLANDPQVTLEVRPSDGLEQLPDWRCDEVDDWRSQASWSSGARWQKLVQEGHWEDYVDGQFVDEQAFVVDGMLVARNTGMALTFNGMRDSSSRGILVYLSAPVLTAKLVQGPNGLWRVEDGVLGASGGVDSLFATMFLHVGICDNTCIFQDLWDEVWNSSLSVGGDYSFAMTFEARQAQFGVEAVATPFPWCDAPPPPGVPPHGCRCSEDEVTTSPTLNPYPADPNAPLCFP